MKIELLKPEELNATLFAAWSRIQRANPLLHSPFFRPEFAQLSGRVLGDAEVAVLESNGEVQGFFPFHRIGRQHGVPIGKDMSDFQGVIATPGCRWSLSELMRGCRLTTWEFSHLVGGQGDLEKHAVSQASSPYVDLTGGFETFRQTKRRNGSKCVKRIERSQRNIVRNQGEIEFRLADPDLSTLPQLMAWQRDNLERRGTLFLNRGLQREAMLREMLAYSAPEFSGWYATLRAGGRLLAGSVFLRSHETAHWWVSAYDRTQARRAPGNVTLLRVLQAVAELGVTRLDFGSGVQELKTRLMSGADLVTEGVMEIRPVVRTVRRACRLAVNWLWNSPVKSAAKESLARWREWRAGGNGAISSG